LRPMKTTATQPVIMPVDEVQAVLNASPAEALPYFLLGFFCGVRPAELFRLGDDALIEEGGKLILKIGAEAAKTRQTRFVEVLEPAAGILRTRGNPIFTIERAGKLLAKVGCEAAKPGQISLVEVPDVASSVLLLRPRPIFTMTARSFERVRQEICTRLDIEWHPDIMRHSFATYHLAYFGNPGGTAMALGHSRGGTDMLYRHYRGLATAGEAALFWRIAVAARVDRKCSP
jgi:integrase